MNQIGFNPWMMEEIEQRHAQLFKEIEQANRVKMARSVSGADLRTSSRLLLTVGRKLSSLGDSLQKRYSLPTDNQTVISREIDSYECS